MRTLCLTLGGERKERAAQHFDDIGLKVQFVQGIHAAKLGLYVKEIHPLYKQLHGGDVVIPQGHVGNTLSHMMMWQMIACGNEEETFILEDDVVFKHGVNWDKEFYESKLVLPKDWEVVHVGHYCSDYDARINERIVVRKKVKHVHAYLLRKSAAGFMFDLLTKEGLKMESDTWMAWNALPFLHHYMFFPSQAGQLTVDKKIPSQVAC